MTISAPSCDRMMSSTAWRIGVPGAIVSIAASSWRSRRGSSSEGVLVKPNWLELGSGCGFVVSLLCSLGIEPRLDRLAQRFRRVDTQCATRGGAGRSDDGCEAELAALLEPPVGLGRLSEPAREADLAEGGGATSHRQTAGGRGDREGDREVCSRLVDPDAAGNVHEHVGLAE